LILPFLYGGGFIAEWLKRRQFRNDRHLADFLDEIHTRKKLTSQFSVNLITEVLVVDEIHQKN